MHESGIPWDDPSGRRLREWMGVSDDEFYSSGQIALVPMGFCYPGKGRSGDLPPRKECAPEWHEKLIDQLPRIELTLLLSQYAHSYYLKDRCCSTLTETVKAWREFVPACLPLPHPSPRNNIWLKKNAWFGKEVVPYLRARVRELLYCSAPLHGSDPVI